jgi:hypothetical protein
VGLFAALPAGALAQRESSIQPVVLESADSNGATIGIQWNYSGTAKGKTLPSDSITIQQISLDYKLSGTATAEKERNPKNFIDALVDAKLLYSHPDRGAISGGFFAKYEADQSFENGSRSTDCASRRASWACSTTTTWTSLHWTSIWAG